MAFSKTRALEEAAKLVSQRKISQAIKQYLVIAEQDPHDLPLLNTIGDLCVRDGNIPEAMRQFHRLADAYTREGFTLKAIAIYKKIVKLDSRSVDPLLKLADLYASQKLSHEANEQYKQALALCQRSSQHDEAGRILSKLVAQDPANASYRALLAESCQRAGQLDGAMRSYLQAAAISYQQKNLPAATKFLRSAAEIAPRNSEVLLWQARLAAEAGQVDEVNRVLDAAPEIRSSPEGQSLLLEMYLSSGRRDDAAALVINAYHSSPEGWALVSRCAAHCLETGNPDSALGVLAPLAGVAFERAISGEYCTLLRKSLEGRPHSASSLDLIADACERAKAEVIPTALLEALGTAFGDAGHWAKAERIFLRLSQRDEQNFAWQTLLQEARERQLAGEAAQAASSTSLAAEPRPALPEEEITPPSNLSPPELPMAPPPRAVLEIDFSNEWESFARVPPTAESARDVERVPPQPEAMTEAAAVSPESAQRDAVGAADAAPLPPVPQPEPSSFAADLGHECTEVQSYLDSGFLAEGGAALDKLASRYPDHPQVAVLRDLLAEKLAARDRERAPASMAQAGPFEPPPSVQSVEDASNPLTPEAQEKWIVSAEPGPPPPAFSDNATDSAQPGLAETAVERSEGSSLAEIDRPVAFSRPPEVSAENSAAFAPPGPSDPSVLPALTDALETSWDEADKSMAEERAPQPLPIRERWTREKSALDDLARDLEITLGQLDGAGASAAAIPVAGDSDPSLFDSSLEELLSELNAGEEPATADDTPQTHYNLGVAFREMGLIDEAIGEFQKVVKGVAGTDSAPKLLEACSLLGVCFMEKQMPEIAVRWLTRALQSPGLTEDTTTALTYDLAAAYEQCGDAKAALERFYEVYSQNIDYRDIAEKIRLLQSKRA
ncbi:MAG: tetratricopeptide repeat protein [Terriglobia bacterium]